MHLFRKLLLVCLLCPLQVLAKEDPRVRVRFETSLGKITVELYNETPKNRDNFISLVRNGYFKQTLFHRVIRDFWGIKIARDIRVIFLCVFSSECVSNLLGADERT